MQQRLRIGHELIAFVVQHTAHYYRHMRQQTQVTHTQTFYLRICQTQVIMFHLLHLAFLGCHFLFLLVHLDAEHPADKQH